jgi:S-adenosylmethionine hydrolase
VETLTRPIFLLTDFGTRDSYVGQVRAVLATIAPRSPVHDITHEVASYAIEEGAWLLETIIPVLPPDAVVMAVVDPGVGTARKPLIVERGRRIFVGPDNGLLSAAVDEAHRAGSATAPLAGVRELANPQFFRPVVSGTFHGRDIFAPCAAHVAGGLDHCCLGPPAASMVLLPPFCGQPDGFGRLAGHVVHVDRYGNLLTTIRGHQLFPAFDLEVAGRVVDRRVRTFADAPAGQPFCHVDSSGFLAIALNQASAAEALGVGRGAPVVVRCR